MFICHETMTIVDGHRSVDQLCFLSVTAILNLESFHMAPNAIVSASLGAPPSGEILVNALLQSKTCCWVGCNNIHACALANPGYRTSFAPVSSNFDIYQLIIRQRSTGPDGAYSTYLIVSSCCIACTQCG